MDVTKSMGNSGNKMVGTILVELYLDVPLSLLIFQQTHQKKVLNVVYGQVNTETDRETDLFVLVALVESMGKQLETHEYIPRILGVTIPTNELWCHS